MQRRPEATYEHRAGMAQAGTGGRYQGPGILTGSIMGGGAMRVRLVWTVAAAAMLVAACGGEAAAPGPAERALADAIYADIEADGVGDEGFDPDGMRCFADGLVAELGVERLAELGVTATDVGEPDAAFRAMTDAEMERMADLGLGCLDYQGGFAAAMVDDGMSAAGAGCLADRLADSGFFRATFIASMRDEDLSADQDDELFAVFLAAARECLSDDELRLLIGE